MLAVIILSIIVLNVIMPSVIIQNVVAPKNARFNLAPGFKDLMSKLSHCRRHCYIITVKFYIKLAIAFNTECLLCVINEALSPTRCQYQSQV